MNMKNILGVLGALTCLAAFPAGAMAAPAAADAPPATTEASGTPKWARDYLKTVGSVQVTLKTPDGVKTITGCSHEVGGATWQRLSRDCRDLVSNQEGNAALMDRYQATDAIVRDVDLDGSVKDFVLAHWTRDTAGDRLVIQYFPFTGMPYSGYGQWDCDAAGGHCRLTRQMRRVTSAGAAKARLRVGGLEAKPR